MRHFIIILIVFCICPLGHGQSEQLYLTKDTIVFNIHKFTLHCDNANSKTREIVDKSVRVYLSKDFLITAKNNYVLIDYQTRIQEATLGMDTGTITEQKWVFNNYDVRGDIYCNKIFVTITGIGRGFEKSISVRWSPLKMNKEKIYKKLANEIRTNLIQVHSNTLFIKNNFTRGNIFLNNKHITLDDQKGKISVITSNNQESRINIATKYLESINEVATSNYKLAENQINHFVITKNGQIRNLQHNVGLLLGFISNKSTPHLQTQLSYKYQLRGGIEFGVGATILRTTYNTQYNTFPNLPEQDITNIDYPYYLSISVGYNHYFNDLNIAVCGELSTSIFPNNKYDIKLGIIPLGISKWSIETGYSIYDIPTIQYTFNPLGNANTEIINEQLNNFYLGIKYTEKF